MDIHTGLAVDIGREHFLGTGRDGRVASNQAAHHSAHGFDAKGEGRHVEQQQIGRSATENVGLDGRAERDDFVRVQLAMGLFPKECLDLSADQWHTSQAADEDHLIDVVRGEAGVFQGETAGPERALHQFHGEGFELIAREISRIPAFVLRQVERWP